MSDKDRSICQSVRLQVRMARAYFLFILVGELHASQKVVGKAHGDPLGILEEIPLLLTLSGLHNRRHCDLIHL